MRWLMDVCPDSLGWEVWLILCAVIVVLWAAAIAGATALFQASGRPCRSERHRRNAHRRPLRRGLTRHWWTISVDRAYVLSAPRARRVTAGLTESPIEG